MRGFQVSVADMAETKWIDKAALRAKPRNRERRRMIRIVAGLAIVLGLCLAIPARNQWCISHGGHLVGGGVNSKGRLIGIPTCEEAR